MIVEGDQERGSYVGKVTNITGEQLDQATVRLNDVEDLIRQEMTLNRIEKDKAEITKDYNEQIKGIKLRIRNLVRRLNGEDPQLPMEV